MQEQKIRQCEGNGLSVLFPQELNWAASKGAITCKSLTAHFPINAADS